MEVGLAFDLEGTDSHQLAVPSTFPNAIPPAPALSSAEIAGEAVELYWMALLRDVNFNDYATNSLAELVGLGYGEGAAQEVGSPA